MIKQRKSIKLALNSLAKRSLFFHVSTILIKKKIATTKKGNDCVGHTSFRPEFHFSHHFGFNTFGELSEKKVIVSEIIYTSLVRVVELSFND